MRSLKIWGLGTTALVVVLLLTVVLAGCGVKAGADGTKWFCPMHPTYIADQKGDCPICNMKLVPMEKETAAKSGEASSKGDAPQVHSEEAHAAQTLVAAPGERRIRHYRNPMDPSITSPVPMKDSMGMDYVPVYEDESSGLDAVSGYAVVEPGPEAARMAGIQVVEASEGILARTIRIVGEVREDETRIRQVSLKSGGWIEKLWVNFNGQLVKKGQPLLSLYSPELLASQREFLKAREAAARFASSELQEVRRGGQDLLDSSRHRLELFDIPEEFILELERKGEPKRTVTLVAPVSGSVSAKDVFEGSRVEPGMLLFTIADLSNIWIEGEIYEYEAADIRIGQTAALSLAYDVSKNLTGRLSYIYPYLNTETRTLRVRFEVDNPDLFLKPGMYANIELDVEAAPGVQIPESAILDSGERQILFVETSPGRYEPREVRIGARSEGMVQVLSGLSVGEKAVIGANFLLDSESRLRAAISASSKPAAGSGGER